MGILKALYHRFYLNNKCRKLLNLERFYLQKFNGSFDTESDIVKLENMIRISVHGIEKGFSYRETKPAFGVEKITRLLQMLNNYSKHQQANNVFVEDCLSTVKSYIDSFDGSEKIIDIKKEYNNLVAMTGSDIMPKDTVLRIEKTDVDKTLESLDYEAFIASRHSYRFYDKTPVDKLLLEKALKIAEHTPTACNRQGQHVYIFTHNNKNKLLNIGPSRGFVSEVDTAILITVDMRAYFIDEFYQCYVDGGLYAMNLINALHSVGLGCIPLTAGMFAVDKRKELCSKFNIPLNEAPIITIGVGNREKEAHVNASYRKDYRSYTKFDK